MQKTLSQVNGCPQRNRSETEWYGGVQTRWCERSENESRKKTASFSSYSINSVLYNPKYQSKRVFSNSCSVYTVQVYNIAGCMGLDRTRSCRLYSVHPSNRLRMSVRRIRRAVLLQSMR